MTKQQAELFNWVEVSYHGSMVRVTKVCRTYKDGRLPVWQEDGERRPRKGDICGLFHEGGQAWVVAPRG